MTATVDALNDPKLSIPRHAPRDWIEMCNQKHRNHMLLRGQAGWLKELLARVDSLREQQEAEFDRQLAEIRAAMEVTEQVPLPIIPSVPHQKRGK